MVFLGGIGINNLNKNKTGKLLAVMIVVLTVLIFLTFIVIAMLVVSSKTSGRRVSEEEQVEVSSEDYSNEAIESFDDGIPSKTVFAVYGVDKGEALSDVIIVASFDKIKNTIKTVSVPRDTYVEMSEKNRRELRENGKNIPEGGMKINAVHSLSGEYGNEYLSRQLEELLDIHIDYFFEINIDSFIDIVDAVGGVEVDVPCRMLYSDPTQNLYINIKKGVQVLDGKAAQGFVRFRRYFSGDIQRIEMQKLFLKALLKKITSYENMISNLPELITIFIENVNTNMTIGDALSYAPYIKNISLEGVTMETLPGDGNTPYHLYENQTRTLINKLFFDVEPQAEEMT